MGTECGMKGQGRARRRGRPRSAGSGGRGSGQGCACAGPGACGVSERRFSWSFTFIECLWCARHAEVLYPPHLILINTNSDRGLSCPI